VPFLEEVGLERYIIIIEDMSEKILITGADGLLGSHVVRKALSAGYQVRAFIQPDRNNKSLKGLEIERFYGDLLNSNEVHQAVIGCDYLIHTAGSTCVWPSRSAKIWQINYDAVAELAKAVKENNLKRFVHIGSASSYGYGSKEQPGDEESPYIGEKFHMDYLDSKKDAQDFLLEQYQNNNLPVIILSPTFMIGEFDSTPGSGKMITSVVNHEVPGYTQGGKCVVYAGDVAQAAINALHLGRLGECYITGGENLTYEEFFVLITELAGVSPIRIKIPMTLMLIFSSLLELVAKITQKPPLISRAMAEISRDTNFYSSQKAIEELDMPQTPVREAIVRSIGYFKEVGYI
jgi:dihydroflavonol-4-reductase